MVGPRTARRVCGEATPTLNTVGWSPLTGRWCCGWCTPGFACWADRAHCWPAPPDFSAELLSSHPPPNLYMCLVLLSHVQNPVVELLKFHTVNDCPNLSVSLYKACCPSGDSTAPPSFVSPIASPSVCCVISHTLECVQLRTGSALVTCNYKCSTCIIFITSFFVF